MMGLGAKTDFFNDGVGGAQDSNKGMGDPLGFLKKSEQAKKEQEEQKRLKQ